MSHAFLLFKIKQIQSQQMQYKIYNKVILVNFISATRSNKEKGQMQNLHSPIFTLTPGHNNYKYGERFQSEGL